MARGIVPRVSRGAARMAVFKMRSDSSQPGRRYASRPAPNCATPHLCLPSYKSDNSLKASAAVLHLHRFRYKSMEDSCAKKSRA